MRRKNSKRYIQSRYGQKGFSLVETLVAAAILGISITGVSALQTQLMKTVTTNNDRAFASQKATQMFEELRGFVQSNREEPLKSLQDYFHNGVTEFPATLTIEKRPDPSSPNNRRQDLYLDPADMLSQNKRTGGDTGNWRYVRQVTVEPVQSDENSRHVTVKVWYANAQNEPQNLERPLAVVSGILKTNIDQTPPTQVYDMYILAAENMPGWWVDVSALRPVFNRVIDDLASRNPGLEIREHYIGRLGYGRDPFYTPYINSANDLGTTNIPFVYFYPGNVSGSTSDSTVTEVYVDSEMQGYRRNDTQVNNLFKTTDALTPNATNQNGSRARDYAMADQFNNAMRYPQEAAMYRRLNDANNLNTAESEPSLRLLLDGMQLMPDAYRNSQLINVHGELLPLPPVRNYSDAAKVPYDESGLAVDPETRTYNNTHLGIPFGNLEQNRRRYANMRVVAHPENMSYTNTGNMSLRVYGYQTVPLGATALPALPSSAFNNSDRQNFEASHVEKTSIFIPSGARTYNPSTVFANPGVNAASFTASLADLSGLQISKVVGNHRLAYAWRNATNSAFMRITDNDTYYNASAMPAADQLAYAAKNLSVQPLAFNAATANLLTSNAAILPLIGGNSRITAVNAGTRQIVVRVRTGSTATTTAQNTVLQQLVDSKIVINGEVVLDASGQPTDVQPRSISRVQTVQPNVPSPGLATLTLYGPVPAAAVANALVTRMRDYDIAVNPADVFGNAPMPGYLITLYDTPTRSPQCGSVSGLACLTGGNTSGYRVDRLLYRQEYYPAPVTNSFAQGTRDLTTTGNDFKNTARWQVSLGNTLSDRFDDNLVAFETRIGRAYDWNTAFRSNIQSDLLEQGLSYHGDPYETDDLSTTAINENNTALRKNLYNASYTYIWRGASQVPPSERYQYLGDPRLMPYLDAKVAHRYNPKFHNFDLNNNGVTGYTQDTGNGVRDDFLRFGKFYMDGLTRSNSIYNSISGFSNYYYGLGGDLGADGNNTQYNVNIQPFTEADNNSSVAVSDSATVGDLGGGASRIVFSSRNANDNNTRWIGLHWMGETFPDEEYEFWKYNGNLPTNGYNSASHNACGSTFTSTSCAATEDYYKGRHNTAPLSIADRNHNPGGIGSPTFMNGNRTGSGNEAFGHESTGGRGDLTTGAGSELNRAFNLSLESRPQSTRPFRIDMTTTPGLYGDVNFLAAERNRLQFLNVSTGLGQTTPNQNNVFYLYESNSWITSGLLRVTNQSNQAGFVLVNGLAQANQSSKTTIARFSVAGMLQAYMLGGDVVDGVGNDVNRTRPIPRVQITRPSPADIYEDPSAISVEFDTRWERWDQEPYAPVYDATANWYDETEIVYIGKYSTDAGQTWRNLNGTASPRGIGVYDANDVISSVGQVPLDADGEDYTFNWDVSSIPAGRYLLRIEAHRIDDVTNQLIGTGYAYHQSYVSIRRN